MYFDISSKTASRKWIRSSVCSQFSSKMYKASVSEQQKFAEIDVLDAARAQFI